MICKRIKIVQKYMRSSFDFLLSLIKIQFDWFLLTIKSQNLEPASKDDAIYNLVHFCIKSIALSSIVVLSTVGIPLLLKIINFISKDQFFSLLGTIVAIAIALFPFLFSRKRIETKITKQINGFDKTSDYENLKNSTKSNLTEKDQKILDLQKQIQDLKESTDTQLNTKQEHYYLARAYVADNSIIDRVSFKLDSNFTRANNNYTLEEAKVYLDKIYADSESRTNLRAVIATIKEESWSRLASCAALVALNMKQSDVSQLNTDPEKKLLLIDIYVYLYAWLVSSINNNAEKLMPVEYIPLRYPNPKCPEVEVYKSGFDWLADSFADGEFVRLLNGIQNLEPEEIEICKEIAPYLRKLIIML